jgi:hypothetical protein
MGIPTYPIDYLEMPGLNTYCAAGQYMITTANTRYDMGFLVPNTFSCGVCQAGNYCTGNDRQIACPVGTTSPPGSTNISQCT